MVKAPTLLRRQYSGVEKIRAFVLVWLVEAIHGLMNDSDKILVMGHQREDYDALGGAIGVVSIARTLGKRGAISTFKRNKCYR